MGTYFEYLVPEDTFYDAQDGGTRNLSLVLMRNNTPVASGYWVQLDPENQLVYGLATNTITNRLSTALLVDTLQLRAVNSFDLTVTTDVLLTVDTSLLVNASHEFQLEIELSINAVWADVNLLIAIVRKLCEFLGDDEPADVTVMSVENMRNSSILVKWTNNTVSQQSCDNDTVLDLFSAMTDAGLVTLQASLDPFIVNSVAMQWLGVCLHDNQTTPSVVSKSDNSDDGIAVWIFAVVVVAIVIVAIACLLATCACLRDQRRSRSNARLTPRGSVSDVTVSNRKPIIMESELELQSSERKARKARQPVVLPTEIEASSFTYHNAGFQAEEAEMQQQQPPAYTDPANANTNVTGNNAAINAVVDDASGGEGAGGWYQLHVGDSMNERFSRPPPAYRLPPPYIEKDVRPNV